MRAIGIVFPLVLGAVAVAAVAAGHSDPSPPHPIATVTGGSFELGNSRGGAPIFEASDIGPGDGASGTVTIANEGEEAGALTLRQHNVVDTPGAGGGLLSRGMSMRIQEVGGSAKSSLVYDGALAPMPPLELGPLGPGQSRVFEFDATLPDSGTPAGAAIGDNAFQGAALSAGYSWTASELPPTPPVAPRSTTPSSAPPTAASTPGNVHLTLLRVRGAIWHHRLVLWAYCGPGTCQVLARLRFKAHGSPRSHGKTLGSLRQERLIAGSQRLVFKLPPRLRRALRAAAERHTRATASVVLALRNREAEAAPARASVRLRHLQPGVRHGRR